MSARPLADEHRLTQQDRSGFALVKRVTRTIACLLVVVFALLSFPSVVPWMVAFWLACHTLLAWRERPAWAPLAACLAILVVKLVPRTPAMMLLGCVLLAVAAIRFKQRVAEPRHRMDWRQGALVLWIAWALMFYEYRSIETCDQPVSFDESRPVVCLGDSLTQGLLPDHGYPEQLKEMIAMPVVNLGFSGISTSQGLAQMQRVLSHDPQVVVIELGGHDFLKGRSRSATRRNLVQMINECRLHGTDVIMMEIPRGFIFDPFASLVREIAYQHDVQLISDSWLRQIVIMSPVAPPGMWLPDSRLSDDGIHTNPAGSKAIAERVAGALEAMYGNRVLPHHSAAVRDEKRN